MNPHHYSRIETLVIGSFHRPPGPSPDNLRQLDAALSDIHSKFKSAVILLEGDFNLGDTDWSNSTVKQYANPLNVNFS